MKQVAGFLLTLMTVAAQTRPSKPFVGTVIAFRPESAAVEIKPDSGEDRVVAHLTTDTLTQKIAPGARDLKTAQSIDVTDIMPGDRVLVTLDLDSSTARRILVMSAGEIAQRSDADRNDWQVRGMGGVVTAKAADHIAIKIKTSAREAEAVISVDQDTSFKQYAPDSVRFSDAKPSALSDIKIGDQILARGEKSADGLNVRAREVVFGTFVVKAGVIMSVKPESKEITVKELGTNTSLTIVLTADSKIKAMPILPGRMMSGAGSMSPGPGPAGGSLSNQVMSREGPTERPPGFDINLMLERMPMVKLEDLKAGSTVIISSTKGANNDSLTAIMMIADADMLIQMASMRTGNNRQNSIPGMPSPETGPNAAGMLGGADLNGLAGLGLSGMTQ